MELDLSRGRKIEIGVQIISAVADLKRGPRSLHAYLLPDMPSSGHAATPACWLPLIPETSTLPKTCMSDLKSPFLCDQGSAISVSHQFDTALLEIRVTYVAPFDLIKGAVDISTVKGELRVSVSYDNFINLMQRLVASVLVDEEWYMKQYEDVADAVRTGKVRSARAHFVENGYIEGRLPGPIIVDEEWYFGQYLDVAESVRRGGETSAQSHFDRAGYKEGRLPFRL
jgi:hypothetical protein